ncbi:MAG: hypothetical protein HQK59_06005 [Deltaproteobacteria bacterium]|nr:hypothetical protein [Deltaproteobacteria bacterium]
MNHRVIRLNVWQVLLSVGLTGAGWMFAFYLAGVAQSSGDLARPLYGLGFELAKAITIGFSLGVVVKFFLEKAAEPSVSRSMDTQGITDIYASRVEAIKQFLGQIRDPNVTSICLIGISLRDFLTGGGRLRNVWIELLARLQEEQNRNLAPDKRLRVRLLLLDPKSSEGTFRHEIENTAILGGGLRTDISAGISDLIKALDKIYDQSSSEYLEARLYHHCPFAFMFISNTSAFIEQYCYRDHAIHREPPLLLYSLASKQYQTFLYCFNKIWENARPASLLDDYVGVAQAVHNAKILNIFRHDERNSLSKRQIACLQATQSGKEIQVQAITGRFYADGTPYDLIRNLTAPADGENGGRSLQFLIMNPVSEQAILRAVADSCPAADIGNLLTRWDWAHHSASRLYSDAIRVLEIFQLLKDKGHNVELRLATATINAALMLTPTNAFIEQYLYGRSQKFFQGFLLGGEYPVIEFEANPKSIDDTVEVQILKSTFDVMWNSYSIPVATFIDMDNETEFKASLSTLKRWCEGIPIEKRIKMLDFSCEFDEICPKSNKMEEHSS